MPSSEVPPLAKLLGTRRIKVRIVSACVAVLAIGAWLRPQTAAPLAPPSERPAPLLDEQVQQRTVPAVRGIEDAVMRLPARGVAVLAANTPATIATDFSTDLNARPVAYGVAVSDSYVLTDASALAGARSAIVATASSAPVAATVAAFDPGTGLVLLATSSPAAPSPIFADAAATPGALAVAAAQWNGHDVTVPVFISSVAFDRYGIAMTAASLAAGLPIYTLDGALLAVSSGDGSAWRIRHALDRLLPAAAAGVMPASIGLAFQVVDGTLADAFGGSGLAILNVVADGPADVAGLQAGDLITGIDEAPGDAGGNLAAAIAALPAGAPVSLVIRRDGKPRPIVVTPAPAYEVAALARRPAPAGPSARRVFALEALSAAAVPPEAVILMINGRSANSPEQAAREVQRVRGLATVLLEHRGRKFFAAIDTAR
jgi:S1-C subfamily serine protease